MLTKPRFNTHTDRTRRTTSQHHHVHGAYLCMAINNSLWTPERWNFPPSLHSLAGQTFARESGSWLPPSFSSPSLSFSSFSHFTHLKQGGLLTLICHTNILLVTLCSQTSGGDPTETDTDTSSTINVWISAVSSESLHIPRRLRAPQAMFNPLLTGKETCRRARAS